VFSGNSATLAGDLIEGNSASFGGAAEDDGSMTVINSTILGNTINSTSTATGGGFVVRGESTSLFIVNSTITQNTCDSTGTATGGGVTAGSYGEALIYDSIISGNVTSGTGPDGYEFTNGTSGLGAQYSLIGNTAGSGIASMDGPGLVLNPSSTGLGTLGADGGPTETIPLVSGSPAIDAGGPVTQTAAAITSSTTSIGVSDGSNFSSVSLPTLSTGSYFTIEIGGEQMNVTGLTLTSAGIIGNSATLTVTRGANGTVAGSDVSGTSVYLVSDQRGYVVSAGSGTPTLDMGAVQSTGVAAAPSVTSVNPNSGTTSGGNTITIAGMNFTGATTVDFGSTAATSVTVISSTQVTAVDPAESAATVDVTVTTPAGTSADSASDQFAYTAVPAVTSVNPSIGSDSGGTTVTITGTNFTGATAVAFGSIAATSFNVVSATQITAVAPAESVATINIIVSNSTGTSAISASDQFTYENGRIVVTTISDSNPHTGISLRDAVAAADIDAGNGQSDTITFAGSLDGETITLTQGVLQLQRPSGSTGTGVITIWGNNEITVGGSSGHSIFINIPAVLEGLTIEGSQNSAVDYSASTTIMDCTLSGNSGFNGGAIEGTGTLTVIDSTLTNNSTGNDGGAIDAAGSLTLVNSTIYGNTAGEAGGIFATSSVTIVNSTITSNSGGGFVDDQSSPTPMISITNSILVGNGTDVYTAGGANVFDYDMIGSSVVGASTASGPGTITDPSDTGLGTLGNNGGPVQTIPLVTGSQALASGSAVEGLAAAINSTTANTFTVVNSNLFAAAPLLPLTDGSYYSLTSGSYFTIEIDNEQMAVTGLAFGSLGAGAATIFQAGSGYAVGNQLTVSGGTLAPSGTPTVVTVTSVNAGAITGVAITQPGSYTTAPTSGSVTGGSGSGAVFTFIYSPAGNFTVVRGVNGSTAATHSANANIYLVSDERDAVLSASGTPSINMGAVNSAQSDTLSWEQQPTNTAVGATITPVPAVLVESDGVPQVSVSVTITVSSGTLDGTLTGETDGAGILTFDSLSVPAAANNLQLIATSSGYSSAASIPFDIGAVSSVPAVTSVSPNSGSSLGGTTVTITGTSFTGATAVDFGSTAATSFNFVSATQITAVAPEGSSGAVDITVTAPGGTSTTSSADHFTYLAAPIVTAVSPSTGSNYGGTTVTVTGTAFTGATAVSFGGTAASTFNFISATEITAVSPAGSLGAVDITITSSAATSATSSADEFTYILVSPTVTAVTPVSGSSSGGTTVTITGAAFTGATAVSFGATGAASFNIVSATQITAVSPAGGGPLHLHSGPADRDGA
jgi:hypothetical protein